MSLFIWTQVCFICSKLHSFYLNFVLFSILLLNLVQCIHSTSFLIFPPLLLHHLAIFCIFLGSFPLVSLVFCWHCFIWPNLLKSGRLTSCSLSYNLAKDSLKTWFRSSSRMTLIHDTAPISASFTQIGKRSSCHRHP